jgi:AcrR family transcriptional regulator
VRGVGRLLAASPQRLRGIARRAGIRFAAPAGAIGNAGVSSASSKKSVQQEPIMSTSQPSKQKAQHIRWGSGTRSDIAEARARLLDAALCCYERLGVSKTSIADIAAQAKVTRPTVYRYFGSHREILNALVRRELDRFWSHLHTELQHIDNFRDYLVEGLIYTLTHARQLDIYRFLFNQDVLPVMHEIFLGDRQYLLDLADSIRPVYEQLKGRGAIGADVDLLMVCELFNRLAISYLATPSPVFQSNDKLRALFTTIISSIMERR